MTDTDLAANAQTALEKLRDDEQALLLESGIIDAKLEVVREVIALLVGKPARGRPPRKAGKSEAETRIDKVHELLQAGPRSIGDMATQTGLTTDQVRGCIDALRRVHGSDYVYAHGNGVSLTYVPH
jgi:hypothetical protein